MGRDCDCGGVCGVGDCKNVCVGRERENGLTGGEDSCHEIDA